jgi:cell division protein ZapA (FtsZ GTPase activity inhibitor)
VIEIRRAKNGIPALYLNGRVSGGSFVKQSISGRRAQKSYSYHINVFLIDEFLQIANHHTRIFAKQRIDQLEYKGVEKFGKYDFHVVFTLIPDQSMFSIEFKTPAHWSEAFDYQRVLEDLMTSFRMEPGTKTYTIGDKTVIQIELEENQYFSTVLTRTVEQMRLRFAQLLHRYRKEGHALRISFDLPKEISTACERYLLFFADFLRDIGIEATSDITHEAGKVLFTVVPSDEAQALNTIREALDVYLEIAKYPSATVDDDDLVSLKWKTAIEALHDELSLTQRALQIRSREVLLLAEALDHQYENSEQETATIDKTNREVVIPGVLTVKPFEKGPIEIDIPNVVRWIKKRLLKNTPL